MQHAIQQVLSLLLCLNVPSEGRPTDARSYTPASSVTSSVPALSLAPEARDSDWEDYSYKLDKDEGSGRHAENPFAALQAGIPDFNSEEFKLEAMLCDLPIPDAAKLWESNSSHDNGRGSK